MNKQRSLHTSETMFKSLSLRNLDLLAKLIVYSSCSLSKLENITEISVLNFLRSIMKCIFPLWFLGYPKLLVLMKIIKSTVFIFRRIRTTQNFGARVIYRQPNTLMFALLI